MTRAEADVPVARLRLMKRFAVQQGISAALEMLAPNASPDNREALIQAFISRGVTKREIQGFIKKSTRLGLHEREFLASIISRGFEPEQVYLFVTSTSYDRQDFIKSWQPEWGIRRGTLVSVGLAKQTLSKIGLASTAISALAFFSLGLANDNDAAVDTAKFVMGAVMGTAQSMGLETSAANLEDPGSTMQAWSTSLALIMIGMKAVDVALRELSRSCAEDDIKQAHGQLEDRIIGLFSRINHGTVPVPGASINQAQTLQELEAMPRAFLPLLTHLNPKELVVFLAGDEDARTGIVKHNPPRIEQRVAANRALNPGRISGAMAAARQSLSMWDGLVTDGKAVNLPSFISTLHQSREASRAKGLAPPSRPRFSTPGP